MDMTEGKRIYLNGAKRIIHAARVPELREADHDRHSGERCRRGSLDGSTDMTEN